MPGSARGSAGSADAEQLRLMWKMTGLAFMMSSEAAAGALIGWAIDHWAGTGYRWLTICGVIGIVVGMVSFIQGAIKLSRAQSSRASGAGDESGGDDGAV